jgi:hypothetical protein
MTISSSPAAELCCAVLCCAVLCQAALEAESRHQLGVALQRTAAAATTLKDAKVSQLGRCGRKNGGV